MRRRQIFANIAKDKESKVAIEVPNSNIISKSAQSALKEKANMFLPHEKDIKLPNGRKAPAKRKGR